MCCVVWTAWQGKKTKVTSHARSGALDLTRALRRALGTIRGILAKYRESLPTLKQPYKSITRRSQ